MATSEHTMIDHHFTVVRKPGLFTIELADGFGVTQIGHVKRVVEEELGKFLWAEANKEK